MQISKKGRDIVAVVRSRQVATVRESSDRFFQCTVSRDRCLWTVERGGRCIQVIIKTGFTVLNITMLNFNLRPGMSG